MAKPKQKMGKFYENDNYRLEVKYSKKAKDQELLKIKVKKGDTVEFKAHDLLKIITENIKKNELALALSEQELEMDSIFMIEVIRTIHFTMDRDVKKGELINFNYPQVYPYFLALCEAMYHLAEVKGEIKAVPFSLVKETETKMMEQNQNLADKINKPTLDSIKNDSTKPVKK